MGLADIANKDSQRRKEHPAIQEVLNEIFESGYPAGLVREELQEQVEEYGIELAPDVGLPNAPYRYDATSTVAETWEVMLAEWLLCDESRSDRRYQQSASRATEHLTCGSGSSVKSALTRGTFYRPLTLSPNQIEEPIQVSAPSAELIRDILNEAERRLRKQPDIIEQVLDHHG